MKKIKYIISFGLNIILIGFMIFSNKGIISSSNKVILKDMNENTQINDFNKTVEDLNKSHSEYSNYIEKSKIALATALTNEGVSTTDEDSFETIEENIGKILQARTSNATATADNITEGKTAWVNGELVTGTGLDNNNFFESGIENGKSEFDAKTIFSSGSFNTEYINGFDTNATVSSTGIQVSNKTSYSQNMIDLTNINFLFFFVKWTSGGEYYPNTSWNISLLDEAKANYIINPISGGAFNPNQSTSSLSGNFTGLVAFDVSDINNSAYIRLVASIANSRVSNLVIERIFAI